MNAHSAGAAAPPAHSSARPNVFMISSPTTSRYLVFVAALLTAGAFVGGWFYDHTQGRHWDAVIARCAVQAQRQQAPLPPLQAALAREAAASACQAGIERRRAGYAIGGAAAAGAGGLLVVYLAPEVVRRRRRLRPLGAPLQAAGHRFAELSAEVGGRRPPRVERGAAYQRDAFSYGSPGRPRVVLPAAVAVRWRDRTLFDPVVRHELAHVRHRDVALAWLARSVWYALAPLLAVPVIVSLLSPDRSILGDYVWRAALLGATVLLVSAALLRSREYDADLRAAQAAGEIDSLTGVLRRTAGRPRHTRLRQVVARHPTPAERIEVLRHPERATAVTFFDGLTSGFLVGLTFPLVVSVLVVLLTGTGRTDLAEVCAALITGPLLGGSVGVGLWRAAIAKRVAAAAGMAQDGGSAGPAAKVAVAGAGVAAGLGLGQLVSLAGTGAGAGGGFSHPAWLAISAILGFCATALSAGMGELWADAIPRTPRPAVAAAAIAVNGLVFAAALWIGTTLQFALDSAGGAFGRAWLETSLPASILVIATVACLAAAAGWALWARTGAATAPGWVIDGSTAPSWPSSGLRARQWVPAALISGILAEASLAALRLIAGPAMSAAGLEQRYYLYVWVAAAAGGACAFALCRLDALRGAGLAGLAAPLATVTAVAGFLIMNTVLGGRLSVHFVLAVAQAPLALGLLFCLAATSAALIPAARPATPKPRARLYPAIAAAAACALLIAARGPIVGPATTAQLAKALGPSTVMPADLDRLEYLDAIAPTIARAYAAVLRSVDAIAASPAVNNAGRATLIQAKVLPPLRALLHAAESIHPATAQVTRINRDCIGALQDALIEYSLFERAYQANNTAAYAAALLVRRAENKQWAKWQGGLHQLQLALGQAPTSS